MGVEPEQPPSRPAARRNRRYQKQRSSEDGQRVGKIDIQFALADRDIKLKEDSGGGENRDRPSQYGSKVDRLVDARGRYLRCRGPGPKRGKRKYTDHQQRRDAD